MTPTEHLESIQAAKAALGNIWNNMEAEARNINCDFRFNHAYHRVVGAFADLCMAADHLKGHIASLDKSGEV